VSTTVGPGNAIEQLDRATRSLRERGLQALGFDRPERDDARADERTTLVRSSSLFGVFVVALVGASFVFTLLVFDQAIAERFGTGPLGLAFPGFLNSLYAPLLVVAIAAGALGAATGFALRRRDRSMVASAFGFAGALWLAAFATGEWGLIASLVLAGVAIGVRSAAAPALLMDSVAPGARVRTMSAYVVAIAHGSAGGGVIVAVGHGTFGLSWRGVMLVTAVVATVGAPAALLVRDAGLGTWDIERLGALVHESFGARGPLSPDLPESEVAASFPSQLRQVLRTGAGKVMGIVFLVFGIFAVPLQALVFQFEIARYRWGFDARIWVFVGLTLAAVLPLLVLLRRGDRWFRSDASRLLRVSGQSCAVAGLGLVVVAVVATPPVTVIGLVLSFASSYLLLAVGLVTLLTVVDPALRTHAAALAAAFTAAGFLLGGTLPGQLASRYGLTTAIIFLALNFLGVAGAMRVAGESMHDDLASIVDRQTSREELRVLVSNARHVPLLGCRGIDFSYDQLQVLFDVDFTVDEGELVALLGTNGAGKSTLLRVVSGLGFPSRGHVHYRGADITDLDAERRVEFGITQMPGGRAVFSNMTVTDNLKTFAFSLRRSRRDVDRGIDATFDAFPQLAERRNQQAGTLSGGEQQMLGLGKAFILRPRLLLIDELSLGLAPIIVSRLLDMVRTINESGTAVVLVEQSVNIALALAHHAYFMEKGEIRFDGPSEELLARPDLVRSVFLEGAARGLAANESAAAHNGTETTGVSD
jgi:ABC-type branched-subunit amino acid transport system ATPase component/MFS family permease